MGATERLGDPGARWLSHMRRGEMAAAWEVSDAVLRARAGTSCAHLPRHLQHVWDGTPIDGRRVLVRCYHGLGDTIQFVRYMPLVKAVAAEVIVWAQPELIPLLQTAEGIDRLDPLHDGAPDVEYDVDVEIMELPHLFRTVVETVPARVPYLHVPPAALPEDERLKVGLVCRAGGWDRLRSLPLELAAPLALIPGVSMRLLHPSLEPELPAGLVPAGGTETVAGTARLMRAMDLVISVDSMPAHLAGALGVPVWTLLRHEADWRWLSDCDDSPWYPTMRLFRQERPGDWAPVVARVTAALRRAASRNRRP